MFLTKIICSFLLSVNFVYASDAPAPVDDAAKEYSGKQSFEWADVQKKLADAKAKLEAQDALVKSLIIEKSHASDGSQAKNEQVQAEHRKLQKMTEEYNLQSSDYQTKFPEKGVKEKRIYKRIDVKSIEGIENDLTLEGRLNKLHKKVIRQYPRSRNPRPIVHKNSDPKMKNAAPVAPPDDTDVTDSIILKK